MTVQFPTSPSVCCCFTWRKKNQQNVAFYQRQYYYFIKVTQKTHFVYIFIALASLSSCLFFNQISTENVGPLHKHRNVDTFFFVDSSVNNILLQTNTDFTSHFLNLLTAQTHCYNTIEVCNYWLAARSHKSEKIINYLKFFLLISTLISPDWFFQWTQKQKLSKVLMASYVRNIRTKNYNNWIILLQVIMRKFVFQCPTLYS